MNTNVANTIVKPEAKAPQAQTKLSDDPRFLRIYCSILNGVFGQFEIYGPPDDENQYHFGEDAGENVSPTKWPDDDFVPGRHDAEEYRIAYLTDRGLWAAQCAFAAMLRADEQASEVEQFNAAVELGKPTSQTEANGKTNNTH